MNINSLAQFDLYFPGHWVEGEDREWAFQVNHVLGLVQSLFVEAVAAHALFQPITQENVLEYISKQESPYEGCLRGLYAKAFVFALHSIGRLLGWLSSAKMNPPDGLQELYQDYKSHFGHLKHIRDSAIHIEDRGRGVTRQQQRINTNILIIGSFIERRFTFTGEDGQQYEIEVSEKTLNAAKKIIQQIIKMYRWT
jgi:hypothetical protein